jgi:hypothetical protein
VRDFLSFLFFFFFFVVIFGTSGLFLAVWITNEWMDRSGPAAFLSIATAKSRGGKKANKKQQTKKRNEKNKCGNDGAVDQHADSSCV